MKRAKKKSQKKNGSYLELTGQVALVERKNERTVSREVIDGEAILKAVLFVMERGLELYKQREG